MRFLWLLVAPITTQRRVDGFSSDTTTTTFRRRSPFAERDRSNAAAFAISQRAPTRVPSTRGARRHDGGDEQRRSRVAKEERRLFDPDDTPSSSATAAALWSGRPLSPRVVRVLAPLAWGASSSSRAVSAADDASASGTYAALLKRYFPGSIPSTTVKLRAVATLRGNERGYFPYNTGLATCLDPDEVCSSPSSVATRLRLALGNAKDGGEYRLGGVGGLPFAGTAGVRDLLRHASPKTVLLFGPVVGVGGGDVGNGGSNCRVGALRRVNRDGVDDAPGVIVRAYRSLSDGGGGGGKTSGGGGDDFSAQEDYVVQKLLKRLPLDEYRKRGGGGGGGGGDDVALVEIARELHRTTASFLFREIERALASGDDHPNVEEVTLLGGIVVARDHGNGAEGGDDWFQPLTARAYGRGGKVTDLYPEIFGDLDVPDGLRS